MFYPESMTETQIVVPAKDLLAVTKTLADQGVFHQVDASYLYSEKDELPAARTWQEKSAVYAGLENRLLAIMRTLSVEEGAPPGNGSLAIVEPEAVQSVIDGLTGEVDGMSSRLGEYQKRLDRLKGYHDQLEPIADLNVEIGSLVNAKRIFSLLGIIPLDHIERLETSLSRIPFVLLTLHKDNQKAIVWLVGAPRDADILSRAARSAYLNPMNLPVIRRGTSRELIDSIHKAIARMERSVAEQNAIAARMHAVHQNLLQTLLWRLRASRMVSESIARFGQLHYTYLIVGWVPSARLTALKARIRAASPEAVVDTIPSHRTKPKPDVPVMLNNPRVFGPFQNLVTMFARPGYTEVDPTFLMAITYPLLFGAMFGDVGHGIALALVGILLWSRRVPFLRGLAGLGGLVTACGAAATGFGFLYGSVFGKEDIIPALWIHPMSNMLEILGVAVGAGVVILTIGYLLGLLNAFMARDWGRFFFDQNGLAGFILYWTIIGTAASIALPALHLPTLVFAIPAGVAAFTIFFGDLLKRLVRAERPLIEGGLAAFGIQSVFELIETLLSMLSNTLSYVRVGAFAIAHGGLSSVSFIFANMAGPGSVVYWIILVVLQGGLIVIFEAFIVSIQTMRLEYKEFFGKFFLGGGSHFEPLTLLPSAEKR